MVFGDPTTSWEFVAGLVIGEEQDSGMISTYKAFYSLSEESGVWVKKVQRSSNKTHAEHVGVGGEKSILQDEIKLEISQNIVSPIGELRHKSDSTMCLTVVEDTSMQFKNSEDDRKINNQSFDDKHARRNNTDKCDVEDGMKLNKHQRTQKYELKSPNTYSIRATAGANSASSLMVQIYPHTFEDSSEELAKFKEKSSEAISRRSVMFCKDTISSTFLKVTTITTHLPQFYNGFSHIIDEEMMVEGKETLENLWVLDCVKGSQTLNESDAVDKKKQRKHVERVESLSDRLVWHEAKRRGIHSELHQKCAMNNKYDLIVNGKERQNYRDVLVFRKVVKKSKDSSSQSHILPCLFELEELPSSVGKNLQSKCLLKLYEPKFAELQSKVWSYVSLESWLCGHYTILDKQWLDWDMSIKMKHVENVRYLKISEADLWMKKASLENL